MAADLKASQIACFRTKSMEDLRRANPSSYVRSWSPFVDGKIIPKQPSTLPSKVPFLAGTSITLLAGLLCLKCTDRNG